jgi:hypothetical protein
MYTRLRIASLSLVTLLSGCAGLTGSTSFNAMSSAYREVLEQYGNDNILLNVVRSAKSMPVSFLDMPSVVGSGSVSNGSSLNLNLLATSPGSIPGFFSPTSGSSTSAGANLSVSNSFNFTQASLDNSSFMVSFLTNMRPDVIANLTNSQSSSKTVLYTLAVESVEWQDSLGTVTYKFVNDPYSPDFRQFQLALYTLIRGGLDVEQTVSSMPISGPMNASEVNSNLMAITAATAQPGVVLIPVKLSDGAPGSQIVKMASSTRLCLKEELADEFLPVKVNAASYCKTTLEKVAPGGVMKKARANDDRPTGSLIIKLRSVKNVFDFLGAVVNLQNQPVPNYVKVVGDAYLDPKGYKDEEVLARGTPLLLVAKGPTKNSPLVSVKYQGDDYSIPKDSVSYSNQVLVLVSQMLTLTKVPGAIPPSPAVMIR